MDTSPVIDKIKKLLALAHSSNEHEAALAAAHAQRLLARHNLAMADLAPSGQPAQADRVETDVARSLPKWVRQLSSGVSSAFDCQAIHHPATGRLTFIGVGADVQVAAYTFTYLDRTVRKLCAAYLKQHAAHTAGRQRELLRHSYYLGAVSTIIGQLRDQKQQTPVTPGALVPVKEGLIRKAMEEIGPIRTMHSRRSYVNATAYSRGQADGQQVHLQKGVGQGHTPSKVLPQN
ncbi:MAG: DUF2786 domain-containing protein [Geobacteraceae bacterium]|nr:DUF2786 domain-containing protein [Geobacteraceae bacterium]